MIEKIKSELRIHADAIGKRSKRSLLARPTYDLWSDSMIWPDEIRGLPTEAIHALRPVFRYRTSKFIEEVDQQWADVWAEALKLFPNWIGFHQSRTDPGKRIVALCKDKQLDANKSIQDLIKSDTEPTDAAAATPGQ